MKLKLLSTLLISASMLASGPVFAGIMVGGQTKMLAKPAASAATTPAPKKTKKVKKAKTAPANNEMIMPGENAKTEPAAATSATK